ADTVAEKPVFRAAFKRRRCLVLADGFYEWKKGETKKSPKQPFHIRFKDARPFAFAGLWEFWKGEDEPEPIESCTIITTDANETLAPLHDRMPVILETRDYVRWLDPEPKDPAELKELLRPYAAKEMEAVAVNPIVNNSRNEGEQCLQLA
ncbi:MAG: SOS response-associated peptidase, partial [Planctomycetaceae bacterium]|nr:SOS response-associated peptidase [Planctomycetaceae bacterium]